jgi:hypothetical protein
MPFALPAHSKSWWSGEKKLITGLHCCWFWHEDVIANCAKIFHGKCRRVVTPAFQPAGFRSR